MTLAKAAALAAILFASPALAQAVSVGEPLGTDQAAVAALLKERGYEVRKTEAEDGKIEVYALRDGRRFEIHVNSQTGAVTRLKEKR